MNLAKVEQIYFIGIGGIGMSALARYFVQIGKTVAGYDKTPSAITHDLALLDIAIHFQDDVSFIPNQFKNPENTLVVITPAVPTSHQELNFFKDNLFNIQKRAQVLGMITKNTFCFAVAGTHGKTTTSAILAHILYENQSNMTAFLGGILENYQSNLLGNGTSISVVEADEFDRSFLQLYPNVACITSMDADHLDIYGNAASIEASFLEFANRVENQENLFFPVGLPLTGKTLGIDEKADYAIENIQIIEGSYHFDIQTPFAKHINFVFHLPGRHNLMNALTAFAMAFSQGISAEQIKKSLDSFKGIKRRFSYQIKTNDFVYVDDYAHHPTEIEAVHDALRELYPNKKITAVFQPHLFSRTKDFGQGFANQLSRFDTVLLLEIYPARELPIQGVNSAWLIGMMTNANKKIVEKETLIQELLALNNEVLVTIGAGDIGELVPAIKLALNDKLSQIKLMNHEK